MEKAGDIWTLWLRATPHTSVNVLSYVVCVCVFVLRSMHKMDFLTVSKPQRYLFARRVHVCVVCERAHVCSYMNAPNSLTYVCACQDESVGVCERVRMCSYLNAPKSHTCTYVNTKLEISRARTHTHTHTHTLGQHPKILTKHMNTCMPERKKSVVHA